MSSSSPPQRGAAPPRSGSTLAMIEGRSGRAVLANTFRDARRIPTFVVNRFRRRDRNVWVFGNIYGFRDSPRYLAEHLVSSRPDIATWWIAHSADEADAARAAGLKTVLRGDPEATRVQHRAGVAFFTHGFRDLDLAALTGSYKVFLWHGTPLKRIALDVGGAQPGRRRLAVRAASGVVRWIHARAFRLVNLFVAASEIDRRRFLTAFATTPDRVKVLGSPRFDVIRGGPAYARIVDGDLRARLGFGADEQICLWLPTHRREYGDAAWLPRLSADDVERTLGGTPITLVVKPHPRADWDVYRERLPDHPKVRLLEVGDVDVNCLLHVADALISDYSSVVCDYVVLGRPLHFFAPDMAKYADNRGLYDPYDKLTGGRHHSDWPSLLEALRADYDRREDSEGLQVARELADYLGIDRAPETCRRIVEAIAGSTKVIAGATNLEDA